MSSESDFAPTFWRNLKMEWIETSERVPNHANDVIIANDEWVDVGYYAKGNQQWHFVHYGIPHVAHVTHWMPLPAPPKGKDTQ